MRASTAHPQVTFDGVSKKLRKGTAHNSLRDLLPALARGLVARGQAREALRREEFWAVRDVSFHVGAGECLGIIGPNGAGKSTILKLLGRILAPTLGRCEVIGRVGSLIELTAGFHPDLTGRENVYLAGAILGMRRAEVNAKLDTIVEFAGVSAFLDTPTRKYSSGMSARLGFAVAAHLDPEVLLIDEVLSVGDHSFQERAFARIRTMVDAGTPVVVVSHHLKRVAELCTKALVLSHGHVVHAGAPLDCISAYMQVSSGDAPPGRDLVRMLRRGAASSSIESGGQLALAALVQRGEEAAIGIGVRIIEITTGRLAFQQSSLMELAAGTGDGELEVTLDIRMHLQRGLYSAQLYATYPGQADWIGEAEATVVEVASPPRWSGESWLAVSCRSRQSGEALQNQMFALAKEP
ncbi:MAG: ATPase [Gemmatimonadetes bacterium]|nr:ATPase [Gemmatimonadota bacterium]